MKLTSARIIKLLKANNPNSMIELLTMVLQNGKLEESNINVLTDFFVKSNPKINLPFTIINSSTALPCLTCLWILASNGSLFRNKNLENGIELIDGFYEYDGPMLEKQEAVELINLLEPFGLSKIIGYNKNLKPLLTLFLPYRLGEFNSIYQPDLNVICVGKIDPETANNPRYVYLHEIGHALQISITGDALKIPLTFQPIFEIVFNNKYENIIPADAPEVFADSFATAVAAGTHLADDVPFCKLFDKVKLSILQEYFKMICEDHHNAGDFSKFWTEDRKNVINGLFKSDINSNQ